MVTFSAHGYGSMAYNLEKEASQHKRDGDIEQAINCLEMRKKIMGSEYIDTKLAKYLQHADRPKEALTEIRWLLKQTTEWAKNSFSHQPVSVRQLQQTTMKMRICSDAVLICKRAKLPTQQTQFEAKYKQYSEHRESLKEKAASDRKAKHEKQKTALIAQFKKKIAAAKKHKA